MTTATESPDLRAQPSPWILDPWRDALLFVGTPLLILPVALALQGGVAMVALHKWVMALGAMGHHLPGMMRAYGDRALFRQFRTRLIVAPLVLGGACVLFSVQGWHGMRLIAYVWGVWHGLMQTHGFLRIYDSKRGSFARRTAWLDQLMCLSWFGGGVVWSDSRVDYLADMITQCGGPLMTAAQVGALRTAAAVVIAVVTLAFVANAWQQARRGTPPSPVKLALLATSVAFWWYANAAVADLLLGLILFEVFHDVQYLSIVWLFNRRRVASDASVGGFSRFLFRRSYGLMGLYLGMVLAYGALGPFAEATTDSDLSRRVFSGLVTFSALLHFYFDGFIWKVRSATNRQGLGLARGAAAGAGSDGATLGLRHGLKWALFVVPAVGLAFVEGRAEIDEVARTERLTALSPDYPLAWYRHGMAAKERGRLPEAVAAFEREHELDPEDGAARLRASRAHIELGENQVRAGEMQEAQRTFAVVRGLEPRAARLFAEEGLARMGAQQDDAARHSFTCSLLIDPEQPIVHLNLALVLSRLGRHVEALRHAETGARGRPDDPRSQGVLEHVRQAARR